MYCFSDEESKNLLRKAITDQEDSNNVGINLDLTVNVGGAECADCNRNEDSTGQPEEEDAPGAEGSGVLSVDNNGQTTVNLQGAAASNNGASNVISNNNASSSTTVPISFAAK